MLANVLHAGVNGLISTQHWIMQIGAAFEAERMQAQDGDLYYGSVLQKNEGTASSCSGMTAVPVIWRVVTQHPVAFL